MKGPIRGHDRQRRATNVFTCVFRIFALSQQKASKKMVLSVARRVAPAQRYAKRAQSVQDDSELHLLNISMDQTGQTPKNHSTPPTIIQSVPLHQANPTTNPVTNPTASEHQLGRCAAYEKIICVLKAISEDLGDARRESARALLEMMAANPIPASLDSGSKISCTGETESESSEYSVSSPVSSL